MKLIVIMLNVLLVSGCGWMGMHMGVGVYYDNTSPQQVSGDRGLIIVEAYREWEGDNVSGRLACFHMSHLFSGNNSWLPGVFRGGNEDNIEIACGARVDL